MRVPLVPELAAGELETIAGERGAQNRKRRWLTTLIAAPSLNLTAEEKRVFGQLFRQADTDGLGVVTGEVAVKFFEKTRLEPRVLGEVPIPPLWQRRRQ